MPMFNNSYVPNYQPIYPMYQPNYQQPQQPPQQPVQSNSSIIWVQGEAGAKSYLVAPNNTVQLWDSEKNVIYIKSADASGMPSMKVLDYTIRENQPSNAIAGASAAPSAPSGNSVNYATKDDVEALHDQITGLRAEIDSLTIRKSAPKAKKEEDDE